MLTCYIYVIDDLFASLKQTILNCENTRQTKQLSKTSSSFLTHSISKSVRLHYIPVNSPGPTSDVKLFSLLAATVVSIAPCKRHDIMNAGM